MKPNILAATLLLGLFAAQPAQAQQMSEAQLIEQAMSQGQAAMTAPTIRRAKILLQRASNCLFGRDSGYFIVGAGGPCNSRVNLTTSIPDQQKRKDVFDAANILLAGSGQSILQRAQDYAEDAVALLQQAMEAEEDEPAEAAEAQ